MLGRLDITWHSVEIDDGDGTLGCQGGNLSYKPKIHFAHKLWTHNPNDVKDVLLIHEQ